MSLLWVPITMFAFSSVFHAQEITRDEGVEYYEKHIRPLLAKRGYQEQQAHDLSHSWLTDFDDSAPRV